MANSQITAMRRLGMTEEEISQVLADDKRIDKGEKLFELSAEQVKASAEARRAGKGNPNTKPTTKTAKVDTDKRF